MSDLISRSALLKKIAEEYDLNYGEILINPERFYEMVETVPTAYDVEKVVECLEEKVELAHKRYVDCPVNSPCYERYRTQYNERRMCLDIVEGGGVNDD